MRAAPGALRCAPPPCGGLDEQLGADPAQFANDPRAIDVHIRHLREKLEEQPDDPSLIMTVRGAGYRFEEG